MDNNYAPVIPLRPKTLGRSWEPPQGKAVLAWVGQLGSENSQVLATVQTPMPVYRHEVYRLADKIEGVVLDKSNYCTNWVDMPVVENVTQRIAVQRIIRALIESDDLHMEPAVLKVIDKGGNNLHDPFKTLWDARFCQQEADLEMVDAYVRALTHWTLGRHVMDAKDKNLLGVEVPSRTHFQQYDLLFLWLSLAKANDQFDRIILPLDGVEKGVDRAQEFVDLLTKAQWWSTMGSPLGIMLGFAGPLGDEALEKALSKTSYKF